MVDTRAPELQLLPPSRLSTQPPRVCVICDKPTKKYINVSFSRSGPEDEPYRGSGKIYACGEHLALIAEMSTTDLERMMAQEDVAQVGTGFAKELLEEAPAVPYDAGSVDTATAAIIEQTLQQEAASYAKLPDPNLVYVELLQKKADSFRNAVKDAMAKDAERISAPAPDEAAAEELN